MDHDDPTIRQAEPIIVTIRPGLHITQSCFRVGDRHFQLNLLRELETQQSGHDPLTRQASLLALAGLVVLLVLARHMHPAGIIATTIVLIGLVILALVSARRRPRRMELWALYRGRPTKLFVSDDWWLFTAVERQLRRSLMESRMGNVPAPRPTVPTSAVPHPSVLHPSKMHPAGTGTITG